MLSVVHLFLFTSLAALYIFVVSPPYEYYGFVLSIDTSKLIEGAALTVLVGLLVPAAMNKVSDFLVWLLYCLAIVPSLVIYGCQDRSREYAFMLTACYIIVNFTRQIRLPVPALPRTTGDLVIHFCLLITFATAGLLIARGGLAYFNLDLSKVYEFRHVVDENVFGEKTRGDTDFFALGYLTGYFAVLAFHVCNPFLIFLSLLRGKYVMAVSMISLQIFFFAVTSQKSYAYSLLFPGYVYLLGRNARRYLCFVSAIIIVIGLAGLEYVALGSYEIGGSFVGRVFYLPAILNFTYHDIFARLGYDYLAGSHFNPFTSSIPTNPSYVIGWIFSGNPNMNANNGFLATSFMHFGYPGMIVYSVIVGLLLASVDSLTRMGEVMWIRLSIVLLPFLALLTSADLTTSLLSHGVLACLVISWFYSGEPERSRQGMDR